ncbi:MAG: class II fumarate hydratase [Pseudohongiellaceae bacterium]
MREEKDSIGPVKVPDDALWGAQTQRSLTNFPIGRQQFPSEFIRSFALVKKAAALSNYELGKLDKERCHLIGDACDEIIGGKHPEQFPLSVWQTGSGTQTNMNLNEVIANRGNQLAGGQCGRYEPLHPNDHVNMSQSSNDVFPTVMHVVTAELLDERLFPALSGVLKTLDARSDEFAALVKSGRTHMMDAVPVTLGQEFQAFHDQVLYGYQQLKDVEPELRQLALGGSAVGTGLNTHPEWAGSVSRHISALTDRHFRPADNFFMALAGHEVLVDLHGRLTTLATSLFKMANDIRMMNSGPRCGLGEVQLPANEPGSSIMPGKVNPTQIEALTMVCLKVIGNNTALSTAGTQGHFQLNVYKPLITHLLIDSITLLADAAASFDTRCLQGLRARPEQLTQYMERSLMLVTALSPVVGYDDAARIAKYAQEHDTGLREAAQALDILSGEEFDRHVDPRRMLSPGPGRG